MAAIEPTHLLSNGRYAVALRANGAGCEPLGQPGHHALARRRAARRATAGSSTCAGTASRAPVSLTQHPAPDPRGALPLQLPRRPGRLRRDLARARGDDDGLGQPGGRHRVPPRRPAQLRRAHARPRAAVVVRGHARRPARRRGASGVLEPVRAAPSGRPHHQALVFERKPRLATDKGLRRRALPRRGRAGRRRGPDPGRPPALARPQPRREPSARRLRRAAGRRPKAARARPSTPASIRSRAFAVRLQIAPQRQGAAHLLHRRRRRPGDAARGDRQVPPGRQHRARLADVGDADRHPPARDADQRRELRRHPDADHGAARCRSRAPTCAPAARPADVCDRRLLWRFGISGDRPIVLVSAGVAQGLGLLRSLAQALRLWSWGGVACDLVVVNHEPASYLMALSRSIAALQGSARGRDRGAAGQRRHRLPPAPVERPARRRDLDAARAGARAPQRRRPAARAPRAGARRAARARVPGAPGRLGASLLGGEHAAPRRRRRAPGRRLRGRRRRVPLRRQRAVAAGAALGQRPRQPAASAPRSARPAAATAGR